MEESMAPKLDLKIKQSLDKRIEIILAEIWEALKSISVKNYENKENCGYLIVVGTFSKHDYEVPNLRQMGESNIQSFMSVGTEKFNEFLSTHRKDDGALIVDQHGQILANKVYVITENPTVDIDSEGNTRHIAAVSASMRDDVISVFLLSEESNKVKKFIEGKLVETFDYVVELEEEELKEKHLEQLKKKQSYQEKI